MSVIRIKKREHSYLILDVTALKDSRLSFRAKGLHTYLMSKPDHWRVHIKQLASESPREGREAIMTALRELEAAGYIRRHRRRDAKGRLLGWETTVYETPSMAEADDVSMALTEPPKSVEPTSVEPTSAEPTSVEPHLVSIESSKNGKVVRIEEKQDFHSEQKRESTDTPTLCALRARGADGPLLKHQRRDSQTLPLGSASAPNTTPHHSLNHQDARRSSSRDSLFDQFWRAYPRKVGKGAARKIWARLKPDAALTARMLAAIAQQQDSPQWQKDGGQYIPYPATWLNQERWDDEPCQTSRWMDMVEDEDDDTP